MQGSLEGEKVPKRQQHLWLSRNWRRGTYASSESSIGPVELEAEMLCLREKPGSLQKTER